MKMKIKKRIGIILFALCLCLSASFPVSAAGDLPRLVDDADLLGDNAENEIRELLDEISERQQVDVVIVTVDSLGGKTPEAFADDFYDYNGYGFGANADGILLMISMEERDWHITTTGFGITAFTDAGIDYISDAFLSDLSDGYYVDAFTTYANLCDKFITQAKTGEPYDIYNMPRVPFHPGEALFLSIVIGFILAVIAVIVMAFRLRSVGKSSSADDYVKKGSMKITHSSDYFLYKHTDTRLRPKESSSGGGGSSTHTSSSGTTHGGGGGKF